MDIVNGLNKIYKDSRVAVVAYQIVLLNQVFRPIYFCCCNTFYKNAKINSQRCFLQCSFRLVISRSVLKLFTSLSGCSRAFITIHRCASVFKSPSAKF